MPYYVYILADRKDGTVVVGLTDDLARRMREHRAGAASGHPHRHGVTRLVHFETYDDPHHALQRERNIRHWRRPWQAALIEAHNPDWRDLSPDVVC